MSPKKTGSTLRERQKAVTRNELVDAAWKLFVERGYENVTLAMIAEEAQIHVQTLYRHFESKAELALARDFIRADEIFPLFEDPDRTEDTVSIWRKNRLASWSNMNQREKGERKDIVRASRVVSTVPELKAHTLAIWRKVETVLTINIAKDAGTDSQTDMSARLMASLLVSSNLEVIRRWNQVNGQLDGRKLYEETLDNIEKAFVSLDSVK